jgi:hypothetical protein
MALTHSPRIITDGLVLCLDAGNPKSYPGSGTTWTDLSGRGNTGTLVNDPTYDGANGGSLVFDAVDDRVECGNADSLNFGLGSFSASVWFTRGTNATTNLRILSKGAQTDTVDQAGFAFFAGGGGYQFIVNPSATRLAPEGGTYTTNQWTNIVGTWEKQGDGGAIISQYTNGTLVGSSSTSTAGSVSNSSLSLTLGSGRSTATTPNLFHDGKIGIVKLYNRALTASEIQQNFNALRGRYGI